MWYSAPAVNFHFLRTVIGGSHGSFAKFEGHARLPYYEQVATTVTDGCVRLKGRVHSLSEMSDEQWAAENPVSVAGVINEWQSSRQ